MRRHLAALAGFTALALAYTYPLARHLTTHTIGFESDSSIWMWYIGHFRDAVRAGANPFWTDMIYWPHGVNLMMFHGLFYAVACYGLLPLLGLAATYNAVMLQTMVLSGYFVFLIADEWGAGWAASFVAGALYAFAPDVAVLINAGIGFDHLSRQVIPLFVWALSRAMRTRRLGDSLLAALALCVVWGCNFYFFLLCALMIPFFYLIWEKPVSWALVPRPPTASLRAASRALEAALAAAFFWLAWSLRAGQREFHGAGSARTLIAYVAPYVVFWGVGGLRLALSWRLKPTLNSGGLTWKSLRPYAAASGFWAILNLPMIISTILIIRAGDYGSTPSPWRGGGNPTDVGWLLLPNLNSAIWGSGLQKWLGMPYASAGGVGLLPLAGALWLWRQKPQDRWVKLWFAGAAFGFVLTLGPWLKIFGFHTYLPLPFYFMHLLPFYNNIQTGFRLEPFGMMFLALLFAVFLREAARRVPARRAPWPAALAFGVLLVEFTSARIPLYDAAVPPIFQRLGERPDGAVLPVPWGACFDGLGPNGFLGTLFMAPHHQLAHHKPFVGGQIGRVPRHVYEKMKNDPFLQAILGAQSGAVPDALLRDGPYVGRRLREMPIRYVLVNTTLAPKALQDVVRRWPVKLIDEEGPLRLYAVGL
ncbi:MAG: hypothetical protein HY923_00985 [Elusimicrobia bacterium]|nr:hypothetical protein [Elusimicrobiota bacterium]